MRDVLDRFVDAVGAVKAEDEQTMARMAFRSKSAAETKAAAIIRIADQEAAPLSIGVDQLRQVSPRLTPLAIGQMYRRHHDELEAALLDRGYTLVGYADQGPGRGMEFEIGVSE